MFHYTLCNKPCSHYLYYFIVSFLDGSIYQVNLVPTYMILITIEIYYVYIKNLGLESVYCLFTTLCEQRTYFSRGGILRK